MTEQEYKDLMSKFQPEAENFVKGQIEALQSNLISKDDFEKAIGDLTSKTVVEELTAAVKEQGIKLLQLQEGKKEEPKSLVKQLEERKEDLAIIEKGGTFQMNLKTVVNAASLTSETLSMYQQGVGQLPTRGLAVRASLGPDNILPASAGGTLRWMDQSSITRSGGMVAANTAATESVYAWTEYSALLEDCSAHIPVSKNLIYDFPMIAADVDLLLKGEIDLTIDNQIINGTNATPQINGMITAATAWTYANYATAGGSQVQDANLDDLIVAVATLLKVGGTGAAGTQFMPDAVYLNPLDNLVRLQKKDDQNNYIMVPFRDGTERVYMMRVIESPIVTVDTMIVADTRFCQPWSTGQVELEIGYVNTDFTQRQLRMLVTKRFASLIRTAYAGGFYKVASLATSLTELTA